MVPKVRAGSRFSRLTVFITYRCGLSVRISLCGASVRIVVVGVSVMMK